ncbi:MAG: hypothetical protein JNK78_07845 [Planctomycetes bacterium]|nr:hypothetical protein [Planctomycetota bacterium]
MNSKLVLASLPFVMASTLAVALPATDLVVQAGGPPGTYPTVQAAIVAAQPGDRVLVMPGAYPAFSVTKAISVYGMGTSSSDVVVAGVHFGLGFPNQGYRVSIARLRIDAGPLAPLAVTGQELGTGQIEFESVEVFGGFRLLAGEPGFVLSLANCTVEGDVGQGFDGGTCHVAAPAPSTFTITRSRFRGSRGDLFAAQAPLAALVLDRGATVRIEQCSLSGGEGGVAQAGAPGLHVRLAQVKSLGGGSSVYGGNGGSGAAGGPGVKTTSTVFRGTATVVGGIGAPNGPIVAGGGSLLATAAGSPELVFLVDQTQNGPVVVRAGTDLEWHLASSLPGVVLMSPILQSPLPAPYDSLVVAPATALFLPVDAAFAMPSLGDLRGLPLFFQGVAIDAANGAYPATAAFAIHVDG